MVVDGQSWHKAALQAPVTQFPLKQESGQDRNKMVQVRRSGGEAGAMIKLLGSYYSTISYCCSCSLERRVPGAMLLPQVSLVQPQRPVPSPRSSHG